MDELSDRTLAHLRMAVDLPDLSETKYELIGEIGRGGMGAVYLARDLQLDREVAIKVVAATGDFEARTTARLEHPGIVPVHDTGTLPDGRVYFVMKRIEGTRLDEYCKSGVPLPEVLRVFIRACEPVAFAHARGIVHRDLKPQNIMTGKFGEVLVLDWGVAQDGGSPCPIAGTRDFMAPEQAAGQADTRSDVYSLGKTLAFVTSGDRRPALSAICARASAANPADRYRTVPELAREVQRFLDGDPVLAHPESLFEKVRRVLTRNQTVALIILAYISLRVLLFLFLGR
jgi:eukaryotic-like serine/threonine-protein kinase